MDNGKGHFIDLPPDSVLGKLSEKIIKEAQEKYPNHGGIFQVGEIIYIRGSKFKIRHITPTTMTLKLLERDDSI